MFSLRSIRRQTLNFSRSHFRTATCSSWPARRTWDSSQILEGFSFVMFFAPWLHVEQSVRRFGISPSPPVFFPPKSSMSNFASRPVKSSMSPGAIPHIAQKRSPWSTTRARCLVEMPGAKVSSHCSGTCCGSRDFSIGCRCPQVLVPRKLRQCLIRSERLSRRIWHLSPLFL